MLSNADQVMKVLGELQSGYIREAGTSLSDDFIFDDSTPGYFNKNQFLDLFQGLVNAIPDLSFNMKDFSEKGNFVSLKIRITGTNTENIDLPVFGIKMPATNKSISLAEEPVEATVINHLITRIKFMPVPGDGIVGLLKQLGIELPAPVRA